MPVYAFEGLVPVVDPASYLHPTAVLIGDVVIGPGCYIGPGASLRGDFGRVLVEGNASVQDNCTLHTSSESDCIVGFGCTIGHGAVLHGCRLGRNVLVGMNSVVLDDAEIGEDSLIGALSLVKSDMRAPARSLIAGNPAKVVKEIPADNVFWRMGEDGEYVRLARRSLADLVECEPLTAMEPGRGRPEGGARAVRFKRSN
ncbi:phenylacetic acid degradation protein [Sphingomonas laterariae]|uniref:Phenylacetic acid degradation protein n=1 Tax=Edaphosphingomonas laterariae TaxID=861865 RepID=A0A239D3K6_9SPHN|nr:phenylacetic acid degradation protein PaaY [Sphingomonas laterariae]SNS27096.1 phenylacetic acid degradation protein [Sphingomonas laterariae]